MKIKLTEEQINAVGGLASVHNMPDGLIIEISEDQIVKEKTNVNKWIDIFLSHHTKFSEYEFVRMLATHYNADAAYKEVCDE